ncbi:uncharacterized protein LOC129918005 [Episyrphus balteatus]|uniref:uncharacterized protein LOC129918005 n=1 Tax=Episyrphus balteatus TaxID=286459 RepID=UPI002484F4D1|nr:uncharacterized protein LOC129918005 [Episyrphus balteatus]
MLNVIAIFQDFSKTSAYYSYNNIGDPTTVQKFIWNKKDSSIFPDRMRNLHGAKMPILLGGIQTGVIISENSKGNAIIAGFLGHLYSSFAKKHNGRLDISYGNNLVTPGNLNQLVLNGTIEIAVLDWGVMLPVEPNIPIFKVFVFVFYWEAFGLIIVTLILLTLLLGVAAKLSEGSKFTFFLNIDCFRGILGQSFSEERKASVTTKIIYSLVFLLGIMMVTSSRRASGTFD